MSVKVLIADDHPIVRHGLHRLLDEDPEFEVVAEASDGIETIQLVEKTHPDILLLDLLMPGLSGLDVLHQVVARFPEMQVIVISMHQDDAYVLQALRSGAKGYLLKDGSPAELLEAIHHVIKGERYLSQRVSNRLIDALMNHKQGEPVQDNFDLLTHREREVLQLVVEGKTAVEIGSRLSISPRTVEVHRTNLMHKLRVENLAELIRLALRHGDIDIE